MPEQNVALVRQTFEAFKEGGFEAMLPFFPADLEWLGACGSRARPAPASGAWLGRGRDLSRL